MEYLLMELFGGGTADWQMIGETNYDWKDILERITIHFNLEEIEFCNFLSAIFELAKEDFCDMIQKFIDENKDNGELKEVVNKLIDFDFEDDSIWYENVNYLDNDLIITVNEDIKNILDEYFEDKIDEIDDKIGFTYIQINVE